MSLTVLGETPNSAAICFCVVSPHKQASLICRALASVSFRFPDWAGRYSSL